jgi:CheY-like chemotaxis protein
VRRSLENEEGFSVAGECADLASVRAWLTGGGKADVAILDRSLPDGDGLEVVPLLKAAGMKVIVLTVEDGDEEIRAAIDAGRGRLSAEILRHRTDHPCHRHRAPGCRRLPAPGGAEAHSRHRRGSPGKLSRGNWRSPNTWPRASATR